MATGAPATDIKWYDKIGWPVILGFAATVIVGGAGIALGLDAAQMAGLETTVVTVFSFIARQKVTPWRPDKYADWSAEDLATNAEEPVE